MAATHSGTQQAIPVPCPVSSFFVWATAWQQQPAPQILARPCPQRPCWNVIRISWHQVQTTIKINKAPKYHKSIQKHKKVWNHPATQEYQGTRRTRKTRKATKNLPDQRRDVFWAFLILFSIRFFCFYAAYVILLARPALCQTRILCYTSSAHMSNSFQKSSSTSSLNAQE